MVCQQVTLANGAKAIVCGSQRFQRCSCGQIATLLCDWKLQVGTCDAPICTGCTTSPAANKDLCLKHAVAFEKWKAAR